MRFSEEFCLSLRQSRSVNATVISTRCRVSFSTHTCGTYNFLCTLQPCSCLSLSYLSLTLVQYRCPHWGHSRVHASTTPLSLPSFLGSSICRRCEIVLNTRGAFAELQALLTRMSLGKFLQTVFDSSIYKLSAFVFTLLFSLLYYCSTSSLML